MHDLRTASGSRQTCISLSRPDESVFEYTAMMFIGFQHLPNTRNVCLIGLGGGYIPTVFRLHLPHVRLQSVEVDPLVVRLAKDYFQFRSAAGHALSITDGRQYLRRNPDKFDQIWIDASIPTISGAHDAREFLEAVPLATLTRNGVVVQNVHNSNQLFDAQVTTFRSVFSHVYVFEGTSSSNSIIIAAQEPLYPPPRLCGERCNSRIGPIDLARESRKFDPNPESARKILTAIITGQFLLIENRKIMRSSQKDDPGTSHTSLSTSFIHVRGGHHEPRDSSSTGCTVLRGLRLHWDASSLFSWSNFPSVRPGRLPGKTGLQGFLFHLPPGVSAAWGLSFPRSMPRCN